MAVIGTANTLVLSCAFTVPLVKATVSLLAEVVATFTFSEKFPFLKNFAESEERNVDILLKTVTPLEPTISGSTEDNGDDGDGREVVALAEAFCRPSA